MGRESGICRISQVAEGFVKGTDAESITEFKTAGDGIKRIDLQLSSPVCQRMDFEINRQKSAAYRKGGLGPKTEYFGLRSSSV